MHAHESRYMVKRLKPNSHTKAADKVDTAIHDSQSGFIRADLQSTHTHTNTLVEYAFRKWFSFEYRYSDYISKTSQATTPLSIWTHREMNKSILEALGRELSWIFGPILFFLFLFILAEHHSLLSRLFFFFHCISEMRSLALLGWLFHSMHFFFLCVLVSIWLKAKCKHNEREKTNNKRPNIKTFFSLLYYMWISGTSKKDTRSGKWLWKKETTWFMFRKTRKKSSLK